MHIGFVTIESPYNGRAGCGVASYLRAIIPAIVDAGHRVTILANAHEERSFVAEDGRVAVHHFRLPSLHWYVAKTPALRNIATLPLRQIEWSHAFHRRLARVAKTTKIDVVESTEIGSLFLHRIAPMVIRLHGSERIFREHSGLPLNASVRWNDRLEAIACNRAAAITAPSKFHASEITQRRGWPTARVQVIPNAISEKLLRAASEFHPNGNRERIVFYAGRLAPVKGIETLLEAAKLVRAIDPSTNFVLAGPWQMPNAPESYGLENSQNGIRWIGAQEQAQVVEWYKRAAVVAVPSNYETFGLSAIEAMAFGVPVVATNSGALPEVAARAELVPKNDPKALADAIMRTFTGNNHGQSAAQRRGIFDSYAPAKIAAETIKLYESVMPTRR
jgi:glycosyltransferase involved in cell wall biosynthesis